MWLWVQTLLWKLASWSFRPMPVQWRKIYLPFTSGVNRKVDEKVISPPVLDTLENGVFDKLGTIQKRTGYDAFGTDDNVTDLPITARGRNLATREDELLLLHEDFLYTQDPLRDEWDRRSDFNSPIITSVPSAQLTTDQTHPTQGTLSNVVLTVWEDEQPIDAAADVDPRLSYQVSNAVTGHVYVSPTTISNHCKPHVVASGTTLRLYACPTAASVVTQQISMWDFSLTDPTTNNFTETVGRSAVAMSNLAANIFAYDVQASTSTPGEAYMVVLETPAAVETVVTRQLGLDGITSTNSATSAQSFVGMVSLYQDPEFGSNVAVAFIRQPNTNTAETHGILFDDTVTALTAVTLLDSQSPGSSTFAQRPKIASLTAVWESSTLARFLWTSNNITPFLSTREVTLTTASVLGTLTLFFRKGVPASKAFYDNGQWYMWFAYAHDISTTPIRPGLQPTYFLVRQDALIVAKALNGTANGYPGAAPSAQAGSAAQESFLERASPAGKYLPMPYVVGRKWTVAQSYRVRLDSQQVTTLTTTSPATTNDQQVPVYTERGVRIICADFDNAQGYASREAGDVLYLNGGFLWQYDGVNTVESGFHYFPEGYNGSRLDATGNMAAGAYAYKVYYEWTNAKGQRERSTAPGPVMVNMTLLGRATITVPSITASKKTDISIIVTRTEVNPTFDSPFFRVSSIDPDAAPGNNTYILNNPNGEFQTFLDGFSDLTLVQQELDPNNSGQLDNVAPPAPTVMAEGKNRLFIASYEDDSLVRFSKIRADEGPFEFNDALIIPIEDGGGRLTGMSILNENLIIFKDERIYVISGQGPNNLGFGTFSSPQRISSDVGCIDQRSIVQTPMGLMFQSRKGIYLLNQQFQVSYIGAPVEDLITGNVTAATLIEKDNRVVFLVDAVGTVIYDYFFKQWSEFNNHAGRGAVVYEDLFTYLRADQLNVFQENVASFLDDTVSYFLNARTGWFKLEGLQNFQRVRRLEFSGNFKSAHDLNVFVQYDYTTTEREYTFSPDTAAKQNPYHFELQLARQKCMAVRFRFVDSVASGETVSAQAFEMTEFAIEVGLKRTLDKTGNRATAV